MDKFVLSHCNESNRNLLSFAFTQRKSSSLLNGYDTKGIYNKNNSKELKQETL